ncbi:hypothetical protein K470DRAFT_262727 [Piedraia hortae CBS 480.64]|uniref:SH3 domain-containing protein n=1 Tax=Piedraia hortae CBS 480.64 TaxID=1314780 RepID=A0A6A7C5G2_9PEZI|nr:hypothetical protein K470DRAFT_262727 [Piedraia hortae CBS 480.64]
MSQFADPVMTAGSILAFSKANGESTLTTDAEDSPPPSAEFHGNSRQAVVMRAYMHAPSDPIRSTLRVGDVVRVDDASGSGWTVETPSGTTLIVPRDHLELLMAG